MRRKLSGILIGLGVLMILGAAGLLLHNRQESEREASFSARVIPMLESRIEAAAETATAPPLEPDPKAPVRKWMARYSPPTHAPHTSLGLTPTNQASEWLFDVPVLPPNSVSA